LEWKLKPVSGVIRSAAWIYGYPPVNLFLKVKLTMKIIKKYWLHLLLWFVMIAYFLFAPGLSARFFIKAGKPLQTESALPKASKRIVFAVDAMAPYAEGNEDLYSLYGWGYISPEDGKTVDGFIPEIALVSDNKAYVFKVRTSYRSPGPASMFANKGVKLDNLGYEAFIAGDTIQPGKYRITMIFKNPTTGEAYSWDKPARYVIKTPNTLTLK
jgi:hypothetical protein